jgi:thiamine monophosphate kinase
MNEYELIRQIASKFPRRAEVDAGLFGCDAELVRIGQETWGLTIDEFTPEEDRFTLHDPVLLGRNLATATLSDLLAAGIAPRFFLSSLSLSRTLGRDVVDGLTSGVAAVLAEAGCVHCGGDLGTADQWRFTGFAMGPLAARQPLTHHVPAEPQVLCVTGLVGDLNLAAFLGAPTPALELRLREAELIGKHGTACIDTSGGFLDAVWLLHEQSPGLRFVVDVAAIPWAEAVRPFAAQAGVPAEALLLGGAGEYELLFTMPADRLPAVRPALTALGIAVVGAVTAENGTVVLRSGSRERTMTEPPPCPREAVSAEEHARAVIQMAKELAP